MNKVDLRPPEINVEQKMEDYLVVDSVSKSFKDGNHENRVIESISFKVKQGSLVTIFGPNGCGKSTLLNIIAGLIDENKNSVRLNRKSTNQSKIGFLFQNFTDTLMPWMTCLDNIAFPLDIQGIPKKKRIEQVHSLLKTLDITLPLDQYPYQSSGGQNQLTAIARALVHNPDLLLMDEPFSALDYENRISMENKLLDIWSKSKVTTLFISHDIDEAIYLSDKVIVLSKSPSTIVSEIPVNLPRPRKPEMLSTSQFYEIRNKVHSSFLKGVEQ